MDARILPTGIIEFSSEDGKPKTTFRPEFIVLYRSDYPGLGQNRYAKIAYTLPYWKSVDGRDQHNRDYYKSAEVISIKSNKMINNGEISTLVFPEHPLFNLEVDISIPAGGFPEMTMRFSHKNEEYFSVRDTGVMHISPDKLDALWQPYIYSQAIPFYHDGFPWSMAPLPLVFPDDPTMHGIENNVDRGYPWMRICQ